MPKKTFPIYSTICANRDWPDEVSKLPSQYADCVDLIWRPEDVV